MKGITVHQSLTYFILLLLSLTLEMKTSSSGFSSLLEFIIIVIIRVTYDLILILFERWSLKKLSTHTHTLARLNAIMPLLAPPSGVLDGESGRVVAYLTYCSLPFVLLFTRA